MSMNINKLHKEVEARENRKFKTFEKVLDACYKKILTHNQNSNDYTCKFLVPNMMFGLPLYNVADCCQYIIEKLIEKGFDVYLAYPTTLHISWQPKSENKNQHSIEYDKYDKYDNYSNYDKSSKNKTMEIDYPEFLNYNSGGGNGSSARSNNNLQQPRPRNKSTNSNSRNYRPITDYKSGNSDTIYNSEDLDLFSSKLDKLF
jgi:hypothetical protein